MIALVSSGADSNPAGASPFVAIPVPVSVALGDVAIVGIALPASGVTVTPPSSDWTQIVQTDPNQPLGIVVFWATILNLTQLNWVFALSSSVQATGTALVYRGTDSFAPIDVSAALLTASSATHNVAGLSTNQPAEELALFIAGAASGTYTPAANFQQVVAKQQTGSSISAQHWQFQGQGQVAAFSETFSATAQGASVLIALSPSPGSMTFADSYQRVFEALPPGIDNVLDFTTGTGDFYKLAWVCGAIIKLFVWDMIDTLRSEVVPHLSRYKLPDWEGFFGLLGNRAAQTVPQRRAQVLAAWRAAAGQGSAIPTVQSVLGPILGYNPSTLAQIIEADQDRLRLEHSYGWVGDYGINGTAVLPPIFVNDGGKASKMGAQLHLAVSDPTLISSITLTSPLGQSLTWNGPWTTAPIKLYGPSLAGVRTWGNWTLGATTTGMVSFYSTSALYVEGLYDSATAGATLRPDEQRYQETGAAVWDWGVYADPNHLGENGTAADLNAARRALKKLAFSHTVANLIQSLAPYPDTVTGPNAAVPDECIPI